MFKKGVYLCCGRARHFDYDIDYVDIDPKFGNIVKDCMQVPLFDYDFVIATPPCNYWSRANPYYRTSLYSRMTRHLLPTLLTRLAFLGKPFILENVVNKTRMSSENVLQLGDVLHLNYQVVGRHSYWTNLCVDLSSVPQHQDFKYGGKRINNDGHNQGGSNVHAVVEKWLKDLLEFSHEH